MTTVVKFGGSLLGSPDRDGLLAAAARAGAVVVAGGGPFADAVRAEQPRQGFGDRAAHAMAILAMEQAAWALADLEPSLVPCADPSGFATALRFGQPAIWLPAAMAIDAPLPATWDVTSDTLALWLAMELRAERLILLKSAPVPHEGGPAEWSAGGLTDAAFPSFAGEFLGEIVLVGPAATEALEGALAAPARRAA